MWKHTLSLLLAVALAATVVPAMPTSIVANAGSPTQVHLAWLSETERVVGFVFPHDTSTVQFGLDDRSLDREAPGTGRSWKVPETDRTLVFHDVVIDGLRANATYFYRAGSEADGWTQTFSFSTVIPTTFAVYGDFGDVNDVSIKRLRKEVDDGRIHAVLHVGDLAYDFQDDDGKTGDAFMEQIETVAAAVPYMATVGNHESFQNFTYFDAHFSNHVPLAARTGSTSPRYYSFNQGLVHFVFINTEMFHYSPDPVQTKLMIEWLRADLQLANTAARRAAQPWIVMGGHKGSWMDKTNWTDISVLAHENKVDLYLTGHQHNYQRMFPFYHNQADLPADMARRRCVELFQAAAAGPSLRAQPFPSIDSCVSEHSITNHTYYNPKYMTAVVLGSPGCREKIAHSWGPANVTATKVPDYGYGHLHAFNRTHLYLDWELIEQDATELQEATPLGDYHKTADHLWIIRTDRP